MRTRENDEPVTICFPDGVALAGTLKYTSDDGYRGVQLAGERRVDEYPVTIVEFR